MLTTEKLAEPLSLAHGPAMKNRFMLAPLTNTQSHPDGRLSDDEFRWLTMRAEGGFGLTMTCAAHVQAGGQGFPGQLGIWDDRHLEGLTRLAAAIKAQDSVSSVQLHHAGIRSPKDLVGDVVGPSDDKDTGGRALTTAEVEKLRDDFIAAAKRAEKAGFDGVEVHGAHGYILAQFLSPEFNRRDDIYGGSLENRARLVFEIVNGIRAACRPDFQLGIRLSPERFGLKLAEIRDVAAELLSDAKIDYLDMSLWDVKKEPVEEEFHGRSLMSLFTDLPRGPVRLGAAGKIMTAQDAAEVIEAGCDFAIIGRAAILRHDFPRRALADPAYVSPPLPVTEQHLRDEGLGSAFVTYMRGWKGFVAEEAA
ncbi:NADH:flavin oxidoreductase/NADH oxidase [Parvibaculum lavamentivorans DS-1]|uniref:NADH:flavin oxidoreductase/NADH oxidase n=1 Tax=Parvibaculum lavamentivorans (strain DS-1 / DSM 13023 / NCIMB 13966) TaxID=402881 RepID=A7HWL8_PARL1|nr:NADH:flavin oxidoreductase [Parvibaculum lavamentivorans]ABS64301.1 NADH:flavin oxidoreductase/NADH oxidase [Parvibaculum lavamentivorans DS-1]